MIEKEKLIKAVFGESLFAIDVKIASWGLFSSVVTDSRQVTPGALFVPLMGEKQDGHEYIPQALEKGATVVFLDKEHKNSLFEKYNDTTYSEKILFIVVDNTLKALQDAARCYLSKFPSLIKIGITGSCGKTTTKEILGKLLSVRYNVKMNEGNFNSETGLPLSVFKITKENQIGIFEAGMNRRGEIKELADVLQPNYALITNVGTAHIGILGSRQAIAEEKKEIFSNFTGTQVGFISELDDYKDFLSKDVNGIIKQFGFLTTPGFESFESLGLEGSLVHFKGNRDVRFALPGVYNLRNALGAVSVAEELGLTLEEICEGLENVKTMFGRSQIFKAENGLTLLQDCYNANPNAMEAAIDFCNSVQWDGKKIYILGSMLELGNSSAVEHKKIGEILAKSPADLVLLFGEEIKPAVGPLEKANKKVFYTSDINELLDVVKKEVTPKTFVFVKGSRGMKLERVSEMLFGRQ